MKEQASNKRKPTLLDVAHKAGISKTAAGQVLRGEGRIAPETRDRVLRIAQEIGFRPDPVAQRLSRGTREKVVPVFVDYFLTDDTGLTMLRSIQKKLQDKGLESSMHFAAAEKEHFLPDSQLKLMQRICSSRPLGIVCNGYNIEAETINEMRNYQDEGGILVCYDHPVDIDCDQVLLDESDNAYKGARYLLELGHRKIGFSTTEWPQPSKRRLQGFMQALGEFGAGVCKDWLFVGGGNQPERIGAHHAQKYLSLPAHDRPTALCIINDHVAHSFMVHVMHHGVRIPEELSIVSHDDLPIASHCFIPMTAVRHPSDNLADKVVELMVERWKGEYKGHGRIVVVTGDLTVRQSTAPPRVL